MELMTRFTRFLRYLDERELYRFVGAIVGVLVLLASLFMYQYYSTARNLQQRLRNINKQRDTTQSILTKYDMVLQQQKHVDELLKKDPSFKIKQFFNSTLQDLGLNVMLKKEPEISSQELVAGYRELKLDARLAGLSMKQIVELLNKIEQTERVYVKEVTISAAKQQPTLDLALTIATFEATSAP